VRTTDVEVDDGEGVCAEDLRVVADCEGVGGGESDRVLSGEGAQLPS
jgi:hypothetical protein